MNHRKINYSPIYLLGLIIPLFFATGLQAQDYYLEYFQLGNTANEDFYHKKYEKAVQNYKLAFSKVSYVHAPYYARAARATAKIKEHSLTAHYVKKAICQGYASRFIQQPVFKKFRKTNAYKTIADSLNVYQEMSRQQINLAFFQALDSLHFIDQSIIRGRDLGKRFPIDPAITYSDSLNLKHLLHLIEQHGFPSEHRVGYQGYCKAWVLIHHNMRLPQNHKYHSMLEEALRKGEYMPENYCWVIDQGQELKRESLMYYHWDVGSVASLSDEDKEKIDQRRAEVGMPSIKRIEVVQHKQGQKQKPRW